MTNNNTKYLLVIIHQMGVKWQNDFFPCDYFVFILKWRLFNPLIIRCHRHSWERWDSYRPTVLMKALTHIHISRLPTSLMAQEKMSDNYDEIVDVMSDSDSSITFIVIQMSFSLFAIQVWLLNWYLWCSINELVIVFVYICGFSNHTRVKKRNNVSHWRVIVKLIIREVITSRCL